MFAYEHSLRLLESLSCTCVAVLTDSMFLLEKMMRKDHFRIFSIIVPESKTQERLDCFNVYLRI